MMNIAWFLNIIDLIRIIHQNQNQGRTYRFPNEQIFPDKLRQTKYLHRN